MSLSRKLFGGNEMGEDGKDEADFKWVRKVTGALKGYDALMNLVLDEVEEVVRG